MKQSLRGICAALALCAGPAAAEEIAQPARKGEYVLVDSIFHGVGMGLIVPIYAHLTVSGDQMRIAFATSFRPDYFMCEQMGKCDQVFEALTLTFTQSPDGVIEVTDKTIDASQPIDRQDVDEPYIIGPMLAVIDGAQAAWSKTEVVFDSRPPRVRFVAAEREFFEDMLAFIVSFEVSLARTRYCMIPQLAALRHVSDPTPEQQDVLGAMRFIGHMTRLSNETERMAPAEQLEDEASRRSFRKGAIARLMVVNTTRALHDGEDIPQTGAAVLAYVSEFLGPDRFGMDEAETTQVLREIFEGREEDFLSAVRHQAAFLKLMTDGIDPVTALCDSIVLETR